MLDFHKLIPQIAALGQESHRELDKAALILTEATKAYFDLANQSEKVLRRLEANKGRPYWPVAVPLENFASSFALSELQEELPVLGVDGSQIMPNRHDNFYCYLLNIGIIKIDYSQTGKTFLQSVPHLFHKQEQLYPLLDRRRLHIDELYVSLERNLLELKTLLEQASTSDTSSSDKPSYKIPLSLIDGSLIPWSLDRMPPQYQSQYLSAIAAVMQAFEKERIPIFGYISNSRSTEFLNSMRVMICPYAESDCLKHCEGLNEDNFPCSSIFPLTDRVLFLKVLPNLHRSAVMLSGAKFSSAFDKSMQTCFFYCNIENEIARVECPRWLFESTDLFNRGLAALCAQVKRGAGYPVVLAEAHHQAVIKNADREQFFSLVGKQLIKSSQAKHAKISVKAAKKSFSAV